MEERPLEMLLQQLKDVRLQKEAHRAVLRLAEEVRLHQEAHPAVLLPVEEVRLHQEVVLVEVRPHQVAEEITKLLHH